MNTSHWHVQSAISFTVVIYELYYMVIVWRRVCVCVWELRLCWCLKWAMGCSAAAAVCMLMLRQSWRTWEGRGKGQSPPTQTHTYTKSQPAISHLSWWRIRTGWTCWCLPADTREDQTHKHWKQTTGNPHEPSLDDVKRLLQIGKCQFFLFLSVKNQTADLLFGDSDLLADGKCTIKMTVI